MQNIETVIHEFKLYLIRLGYSSGSCKMLPRLVHSFFDYSGYLAVTEINRQHIMEFYEYLFIRPCKLKEGGLSSVHIHHHVYSLKLFFNWLEITRQIKINPISALSFKKVESNPRQPLSREQIQELFNATVNLKEKAALHLFYSCGLRRAEGEQLDVKDIHFKTRLVYVRAGKGAKRRVIPITESVKKELEEYVLYERTEGNKHSREEAFLLNRLGGRIHAGDLNKLLKKIIERTTVPRETSLHHLRHSIATHLLENGLKSEFVRDFLGHAYLESTQIYAKVSRKLLRKL